jgi:hypothetical protein
MPTLERPARAGTNPFQDWMDAMANQRGELDLRLEGVEVRLPFVPTPIEVSGTVTVSFHLRELTEKEREARAAKEIRLLHA